ncbi:MAG: hypothetical protein J2P21_03760 [Chloracidobacterium sp.]|nr:hypothetical protein [Chloracidobacterium sp.]
MWGLKGAEAVLKLRSLFSSENFDELLAIHMEQEYQHNYADGKPAKPIAPLESNGKGGHLRLVK